MAGRRILGISLALTIALGGVAPAYAQAGEATGQTQRGAGSIVAAVGTAHAVQHGSSGAPISATRLRYMSTTQYGREVPVRATLLEPTKPWRGKGKRPLVVLAPGTRGAGDSCGPTSAEFMVGRFQRGHLNFNYEYASQLQLVELGARVIVTDYIGMGTDGHHTYVNNIESAHAVLDAARAGIKQAGLAADTPVGLFGYSQGGGAAAAAAEHAATYAPELNIKGTYAGAPVANLPMVMNAVDGSDIVHVLGYAINGFASRNADFRSELHRHLNSRGKRFLREAAHACIGDSIARWAFTDSQTLTRSGLSFGQLIQKNPDLLAVLTEQNLGRRKLNAPILIGSAKTDQTIPYRQAKKLARDYCASGGNVTFLPVDAGAPVYKTAVNHAAAYIPSSLQGVDFLMDRFNEKTAHNNCARLG